MNKIRVEAPKGMDRETIAKAIAGPDAIVEANPAKYEERTFFKHKALRQTTEEFISNYKKQLDKILKVIKLYVEKNIIFGSLDKAEYKPVITPTQMQEIVGLISDYHLAFIANQIGPGYVSATEIQRLIDTGVLPQDLNYSYQPAPGEKPPTQARMIADAYNYGVMMGSTPAMVLRAPTMDSYDFRKRKEPRLTPQENAARDWAQTSAATRVRGLGNTIADDFSTLAIEADSDQRKKYQQAIREELDMNIEKRESWRKLSSELGHRTGDWTRDFRRIAATEKQVAMQEGFTASLIEREGNPKSIWVAKQPSPSACPECVRLHLTGGPGSNPKIFRLSTLVENGTNVGRKRLQWRAVVGVVHPWCFLAGHRVETKRGDVPIEQVCAGDLVKTHKGRFRAVERLSKRFYSGDIIEMLIDGKSLKTTPDHPYLTQRGWVKASEFEPSDYLMEVLEFASIDVGADDNPAKSFEVGAFSDVLKRFPVGSVPSIINFDGSVNGRQGEIDIERAYCKLWSQVKSFITQSIEHLTFLFRHVAFLLQRLRRFDLLDDWTRFATNGSVGSLYDSHSLFSRPATIRNSNLLTNRAKMDTAFLQAGFDSVPAHQVFFSEKGNALPAVIAVDNSCDREWDSFSHNDVAYRGVPVESIRRMPFEGYVYNFAVEEDESYVCEGVVSHNCSCALVHVPAGWGFDEDGDLVPLSLKRSQFLEHDLRKAESNLTYSGTVPTRGCAIRVGDPSKVLIIEQVIKETPRELFDKKVGATLITIDHPRVQNPMDDHDLAYWTGNEVRLSIHLATERVAFVLKHELAHSLNVHLMYEMGGVEPVRKWHKLLWSISKREGFVSRYARTLPIENAAEATRLYLYDKKNFMVKYPQTFAALHKVYRNIWEGDKNVRVAS